MVGVCLQSLVQGLISAHWPGGACCMFMGSRQAAKGFYIVQWLGNGWAKFKEG